MAAASFAAQRSGAVKDKADSPTAQAADEKPKVDCRRVQKLQAYRIEDPNLSTAPLTLYPHP
jgi:hypothetical protein